MASGGLARRSAVVGGGAAAVNAFFTLFFCYSYRFTFLVPIQTLNYQKKIFTTLDLNMNEDLPL